jgi:hypothetical protein
MINSFSEIPDPDDDDLETASLSEPAALKDKNNVDSSSVGSATGTDSDESELLLPVRTQQKPKNLPQHSTKALGKQILHQEQVATLLHVVSCQNVISLIQTCNINPIVFEISCVLWTQDGCDHPCIVSSSITYYMLHDVIGKKLSKRTEQVQLQYPLNMDKVKSQGVSIQSLEEFDLFISRMQPLIVPLRLANGKPSTCALRAVMVYFENVSEEMKESTGSATAEKKKKAVHHCVFFVTP